MSVIEQKTSTSPASFETSVVSPTFPQPKLPTKAPVLVATLGTTPVKSISFTVTAGYAEGVNNAMILSYSFV